MKAVESLIREHQLIARLADALETYARETTQGRPPDAAHLALFARAFSDFAECIHHEKEEHILLDEFDRKHQPQRAAAMERIEALIGHYALIRASGIPPVGSALVEGAQASERCLGLEK